MHWHRNPFALKTEFAVGNNGGTVEVIASNAPGAVETYPAGSVMAQIAVPLCEGVSGG